MKLGQLLPDGLLYPYFDKAWPIPASLQNINGTLLR